MASHEQVFVTVQYRMGQDLVSNVTPIDESNEITRIGNEAGAVLKNPLRVNSPSAIENSSKFFAVSRPKTCCNRSLASLTAT